jgi:hypothetical protein
VPKDVLMQKWICKHKGLIPNPISKRARRFDLLIDKDENSSTLVLTTAIRPEATVKRYSRGTRGSPKVTLKPESHGQEVLTRNSRIAEGHTEAMQLVESIRTRKKKNMQIDEVAEK